MSTSQKHRPNLIPPALSALVYGAAVVAIVTCGFDSGPPAQNKTSGTGSPTGSGSGGSGPATTGSTGGTTGSSGSSMTGGDSGSGGVSVGGSAGSTGTSGGAAGSTTTTTGSGGSAGGPGGAGGATGGGAAGTPGTTDGGGGTTVDAGPKPPARGSLTYTKITVHTRFLAESATIGDFNKDGNPDIASGRRWWEGPAFQTEHTYRAGHEDLPRNGTSEEITLGVSDDWADYTYDMNGDGWDDIIDIASCDANTNQAGSDPIQNANGYWFANPKQAMAPPTSVWVRSQIHADIRLEQHMFVDMTGDGKPEILGACRGCGMAKGYYEADWNNPTAQWQFRPVTRAYEFPFGGTGWFHGIGAGDVNKDGQMDLIERSGIWQRTATGWNFINIALSVPELTGTTGNTGGSHMTAYDVDGDGDNDIVTGLHSHGWGLAWFEQTAPNVFAKRMIMNTPQEMAMYGNVAVSQLHSMAFADMDGDGLTDIITGKEFLAHPYTENDPGARDPALLIVFKLVRTPTVHFEPKVVDMDCGTGRQVTVGHLNNDGIMDIAIGSKKGLFIFLGKP